MKLHLSTIRDLLKKPHVRYLVLFAVLAAALWFLRDAPCDVTLSIDLERIHRLGDGVLSRMEVKVLDDGRGWISTSTFDYPEALHPDGPGPIRTDPLQLQLQLSPGTYMVSLTMHYRRAGAGRVTPELGKDFEITVDERETRQVLRP